MPCCERGDGGVVLFCCFFFSQKRNHLDPAVSGAGKPRETYLTPRYLLGSYRLTLWFCPDFFDDVGVRRLTSTQRYIRYM